jgi:hypothetical protein
VENKFNSMHFILIFAILAILGIPSIASLNAQPLSTPMNNMTMQQHAKHILDNLVISQHIPLTGDLVNGDYILLMDLTPFTTSIEGHSHIAMKIPCNQDGSPKVTIATGIAPNLKSFEVGKEINNGILDGRRLDLSDEGNSCLYHALLPKGITDILLVNTSNETLNFDRGGYSVTVTVHGTAIQHLGANQTGE